MLNENIDKLILESMKAHNEVRTKTLRAIKDAFLKWKTAKENVGKELDESTEMNLLKKMVKTRKESADIYQNAGRQDLVDSELAEVKVIEEFLPAQVEDWMIEEAVKALTDPTNLSHIEPVQKNMGHIISTIKKQYPGADGAMVAKIVKSHLS